jgi:RNA polymerase sigma-70 factor (ECF subfamily)
MTTSDMHKLAERLARGEEAAFAELYDACADRLHHYLSARLRSRETASDVVQAAFLRAVKSRRRFRGVENPVAYLFQIARNEAARTAKRQPANEQLIATSEMSAVRDAAEGWADAEVVVTALGRLSDDDREIVELKLFAGLTFREVAEVVGVPQATVATRYRRALESLRPWLAKQFR